MQVATGSTVVKAVQTTLAAGVGQLQHQVYPLILGQTVHIVALRLIARSSQAGRILLSVPLPLVVAEHMVVNQPDGHQLLTAERFNLFGGYPRYLCEMRRINRSFSLYR